MNRDEVEQKARCFSKRSCVHLRIRILSLGRNMKPIGRYMPAYILAIAVALVQTGDAAEQANPCAGELNKFCAGVQPGELRLIACLESHQDQLSAGCKQALTNLTPPAQKEASAPVTEFPGCTDAIAKFCKKDTGRNPILRCLQAHRRKLSHACKDQIGAKGGKTGKKKT